MPAPNGITKLVTDRDTLNSSLADSSMAGTVAAVLDVLAAITSGLIVALRNIRGFAALPNLRGR